ncbi:hypothetical protein [uncultured Shewanella sp.]|uniref:hypothetical protein n=1 Tax=uncultured Shewanella sp. TaxID=173975 RepID=UPI00262CF5A3|nr:hypothetical protein [uncultured Shewanella sp.]
MTINAMETGNFYTVLSASGDDNKTLQSQFDALLSKSFDKSSDVNTQLSQLFDVLTELARNNDPDSVDLLMQIACKPDIDDGESDLAAFKARGILKDIYLKSEPDSHRAMLIEQAAIAIYEQSDKQGKLPLDVLTFALDASLRANDADNVVRIIDLLMPLERLSVVEKITAGKPIDSMDLHEDEDSLIDNLNAGKMGSKPVVSQESSLVSPMFGQIHPRGGISSGVNTSRLTQENLGSEKHLDTIKSGSRSVSSRGGEPLSGGIGGGKLTSVSELAQMSELKPVSGRSLVYVPSVEAKQSHQQARLVYVDVVTSLLKTNQQSEDWLSTVMARWDRKNPVNSFEPVQNEPKKVMKSLTLPGFSPESIKANVVKQSIVNPSVPLSVSPQVVSQSDVNSVKKEPSSETDERKLINKDNVVNDSNNLSRDGTIPNGTIAPWELFRKLAPAPIVGLYDWAFGTSKN